jgi:hypothetical protein
LFGKKRPVAYYAHSLRIYGSQIERRQERRILRHGYKVINPRQALGRDWQGDALRIIQGADAVICTEYLDYIGKGVAWELGQAFGLGKPVYVLRGARLVLLSPSNVVGVGINWAILWAKIVL